MDIASETSSEEVSSNVDPKAIVDSLKDMDDLDAELFGNRRKPATVNKHEKKSSALATENYLSPKRNSSYNPKFENDDFDMDDPLAGILSDDDLPQAENKSPVKNTPKKKLQPAQVSRRKSDEEDSDGLFGDDNDDILQTLGLDDEKPKSKISITAKASNESGLDAFLKPSAQPSPRRSPPGKSQKYRFDDKGNLITEKLTAATEDTTFGAYLPSTASTNQRPVRSRRTATGAKNEDDFLDFLDQDVLKSSKSLPTNENTARDSVQSRPEPTPTKRSRNVDFLELGDEVDLDALIGEKETVTAKQTVPKSKGFVEIRKPEERFQVKRAPSPIFQSKSSSPMTPPASILRKTVDSASSFQEKQPEFNFDDLIPSPATKPITSPESIFHQQQPLSTTVDEISRPSVVKKFQVPIMENQLSHIKTTLHDSQVGYQTDLEVTKEAYDSRIEALHTAVADIRSRADREVEAIKESYNMRMEAVRKQLRDHMKDISEKDIHEQEEIKRLRNLHLTALEDTRLDYDDRIKRIKEAHNKDIDTLKSSTVYVRNLDEMMQKVDDVTQQVQQLSAKQEATFHNMEQKWNGIATDNKRILSAFQTQLEEIRNSSFEMQSNLQQTVSRLEGNFTEMNRALREQQYHLQLERNRLDNAQTSLENEKRQFLQQINAQSSEAMKAHKEAIELRQNYEREMREDNDRLRQREEQVLRSQRVLEEARVAESKQTTDRQHGRRKQEDELAKERAALAEKVQRLASLEARLNVQKEELDRRNTSLNGLEKRLENKSQNLAQQEEELRVVEEEASKKFTKSSDNLEEAKRIEHSQESRLNEIHDNANALARQRLLLAEEKKQMIEDRVNFRPGDTGIPSKNSPINSTRIPRRFASSPNKSSVANAAMWMFTAQKDRDFLEDEQIFLEALKYSPRQTSS